ATVAVLGTCGFTGSVIRDRVERPLAFALVALPLLAVVSTAQLNLTFNQPQGRYCFPGLPALAVLIAIGLEGLPRWNRDATLLTLGILVAINLYALLGVELPTYWLR